MKKEFEINEILSAVNNISKIKKKEREIVQKKDLSYPGHALTPKKQSKSDKSEILVLSEMIE
tara:strand:+ start:66 stop:251 length:186 start_codon:yes stop_codon:yes gene_type:complete